MFTLAQLYCKNILPPALCNYKIFLDCVSLQSLSPLPRASWQRGGSSWQRRPRGRALRWLPTASEMSPPRPAQEARLPRGHERAPPLPQQAAWEARGHGRAGAPRGGVRGTGGPRAGPRSPPRAPLLTEPLLIRGVGGRRSKSHPTRAAYGGEAGTAAAGAAASGGAWPGRGPSLQGGRGARTHSTWTEGACFLLCREEAKLLEHHSSSTF